MPSHRVAHLRSKAAFLGVLSILALAVGLPLREMARHDDEAERLYHTARIATQELRIAIQDYHREHGRLPGHSPDSDAMNPRWFVRQLTMASDEEGRVDVSVQADFGFGPYLHAGVPPNPVNGLSDVRFMSGNLTPGAVDESSGWLYDPTTGAVHLNATGTPGPEFPSYRDL